MNWHQIHLADVKPMPWKNGGGLTRELLAFPRSSNWKWRLSVAEVTANGSFSKFADTQRWFAVLKGSGVTLWVDGQAHTQTMSDSPLCFNGDADTRCELIDGPTQDFNFMLQGCKGRMAFLRGDFEKTVQARGFAALYAIDGETSLRIGERELRLQAHTLVWMLGEADQSPCMISGSTMGALWMEAQP